MCGACGTGRVRGPWEDAVAGRGPRQLAERARELEAFCAPLRWRVRPFGVAGFTVTTATGACRTADGVDDVTAAAVAAGVPVTGPAGRPDEVGEAPLSAAEAVVGLSALVAAGGTGELHGPLPDGVDVLLVHGQPVPAVRRGAGFALRRAPSDARTSTRAGARPTTS